MVIASFQQTLWAVQPVSSGAVRQKSVGQLTSIVFDLYFLSVALQPSFGARGRCAQCIVAQFIVELLKLIPFADNLLKKSSWQRIGSAHDKRCRCRWSARFLAVRHKRGSNVLPLRINYTRQCLSEFDSYMWNIMTLTIINLETPASFKWAESNNSVETSLSQLTQAYLLGSASYCTSINAFQCKVCWHGNKNRFCVRRWRLATVSWRRMPYDSGSRRWNCTKVCLSLMKSLLELVPV